MVKCNAPKHKYEVGEDIDSDAVFTTYGINVHFANTSKGMRTHYNQIEVHGDPELRDKIIELLNKDNEDLRKSIPDNG